MPEVVATAGSRAAAIPRAGVRIVVLLVATAVACLSVAGVFLVAAPPASAHDQLLSSDPADGAALDAMPAAIALTFSGEPLETGAEVVLTGADGTAVALEDLATDGAVLTASVPATLPGGAYDVAWHIVSGDGHPLEGAFSFTADGPEPEATPQATAPSEEPAQPAAEESAPAEDGGAPAVAESSATDGSTSGDDGLPVGTVLLVSLGGIAVLVAVIAAMQRTMRDNDALRERQRRADSSPAGADGSDTDAPERDDHRDGHRGGDGDNSGSGDGSGGGDGGGGGGGE